MQGEYRLCGFGDTGALGTMSCKCGWRVVSVILPTLGLRDVKSFHEVTRWGGFTPGSPGSCFSSSFTHARDGYSSGTDVSRALRVRATPRAPATQKLLPRGLASWRGGRALNTHACAHARTRTHTLTHGRPCWGGTGPSSASLRPSNISPATETFSLTPQKADIESRLKNGSKVTSG